MKKVSITKIMILFLSVFLFSCSNEDDNYKTFEGPQEALLFNENSSVLEVPATGSSFIEVLVSSTTTSNVDRLIPVSVSAPFTSATASQYAIDYSSAVIPAGKNTAKLRINSGDYASLPVVGSNSLALVFDSPSFYVLPNRANHIVAIQRACSGTRVNFNILFDGYGSEIGWTLSNSSGVVASASFGSYADGQSAHTEQFCLSPGSYTFTMNDSYGDGLSFPSNGTYTLQLTDGTTLVSGGGNFGSSASHTFTIN